jgi:hypothetical protein
LGEFFVNEPLEKGRKGEGAYYPFPPFALSLVLYLDETLFHY